MQQATVGRAGSPEPGAVPPPLGKLQGPVTAVRDLRGDFGRFPALKVRNPLVE
ncbi:MAG: hypothetical protein Kow00122_21470 [Thermoleophilia bacterium]